MITEYRIPGETGEIPVRILRSARKSIGLEVRPSGEALARIPRGLSDRELKAFLERHAGWIREKHALSLKRMDSRLSTGAVPPAELTREEKEKIGRKIQERVRFYGEKMGVSWGTITIRNQKTRWGSCSARGNLNFNYQLYYLPEELLDYVVVHELAHRRYMNHSAEFWKEVERYYPDYRNAREKLKERRLVS